MGKRTAGQYELMSALCLLLWVWEKEGLSSGSGRIVISQNMRAAVNEFLFHFPVRQMKQSSGQQNSLYYFRLLFVLWDKSKMFFFFFLFQQEKGCRSGSLSSYASL